MEPTLTTRSGRRPSQRHDELIPFISLLQRNDVTTYLEIGARHGDTFFRVMTSLRAGSFGVAVDLPGGAWGVDSSKSTLDAAISELRERGYDVHAIYGDSTSSAVKEAFSRTCQLSGIAEIGAVLIDGDHRYDGVKADWEAWQDTAKLVAFHDIAGEGQRQKSSGLPVEVPRLWRELKSQFTTEEFVGPDSSMGIGVVFQ